jgi:hypothetical protein
MCLHLYSLPGPGVEVQGVEYIEQFGDFKMQMCNKTQQRESRAEQSIDMQQKTRIESEGRGAEQIVGILLSVVLLHICKTNSSNRLL